ncbi:hypothetical protein G9A89_008328 [Geosiphon pyriformis]|nr:hypothetical protein G9A89_008328 [Geosiphon pyriformis]
MSTMHKNGHTPVENCTRNLFSRTTYSFQYFICALQFYFAKTPMQNIGYEEIMEIPIDVGTHCLKEKKWENLRRIANRTSTCLHFTSTDDWPRIIISPHKNLSKPLTAQQIIKTKLELENLFRNWSGSTNHVKPPDSISLAKFSYYARDRLEEIGQLTKTILRIRRYENRPYVVIESKRRNEDIPVDLVADAVSQIQILFDYVESQKFEAVEGSSQNSDRVLTIPPDYSQDSQVGDAESDECISPGTSYQFQPSLTRSPNIELFVENPREKTTGEKSLVQKYNLDQETIISPSQLTLDAKIAQNSSTSVSGLTSNSEFSLLPPFDSIKMKNHSIKISDENLDTIQRSSNLISKNSLSNSPTHSLNDINDLGKTEFTLTTKSSHYEVEENKECLLESNKMKNKEIHVESKFSQKASKKFKITIPIPKKCVNFFKQSHGYKRLQEIAKASGTKIRLKSTLKKTQKSNYTEYFIVIRSLTKSVINPDIDQEQVQNAARQVEKLIPSQKHLSFNLKIPIPTEINSEQIDDSELRRIADKTDTKIIFVEDKLLRYRAIEITPIKLSPHNSHLTAQREIHAMIGFLMPYDVYDDFLKRQGYNGNKLMITLPQYLTFEKLIKAVGINFDVITQKTYTKVYSWITDDSNKKSAVILEPKPGSFFKAEESYIAARKLASKVFRKFKPRVKRGNNKKQLKMKKASCAKKYNCSRNWQWDIFQIHPKSYKASFTLKQEVHQKNKQSSKNILKRTQMQGSYMQKTDTQFLSNEVAQKGLIDEALESSEYSNDGCHSDPFLPAPTVIKNSFIADTKRRKDSSIEEVLEIAHMALCEELSLQEGLDADDCYSDNKLSSNKSILSKVENNKDFNTRQNNKSNQNHVLSNTLQKPKNQKFTPKEILKQYQNFQKEWLDNDYYRQLGLDLGKYNKGQS